MALNYTTWVAQIANMLTIISTNDNFQTALPGAIDYAEQRIYRETDLLATRITDTSVTASSGVRTMALSTAQGTYLVVEQINLWSPAGTPSSNATRNPLTFTSHEFIDAVYPSAASLQTGMPKYVAMTNNATVVMGPAPDAGYTAEVVGTQRPAPLSAANSSTILTQVLPDVFFAATMVFMSGYQRDFGSQADNPQMATSWETQYGKLFESANLEELRKRHMGSAWTANKTAPEATPPRA